MIIKVEFEREQREEMCEMFCHVECNVPAVVRPESECAVVWLEVRVFWSLLSHYTETRLIIIFQITGSYNLTQLTGEEREGNVEGDLGGGYIKLTDRLCGGPPVLVLVFPGDVLGVLGVVCAGSVQTVSVVCNTPLHTSHRGQGDPHHVQHNTNIKTLIGSASV